MTTFEQVESGIYRKTANGTYYERPWLNGKRTWRSLETSNLKHARETLHKRRAAANDGQKPLEAELRTVGEIIRRYEKDGYLDKHLQSRTGRTLEEEERNCKTLLEFWDSVPTADVSDALCDKYADWRKRRIQHGSGERTIDRDLNSLNNAFRYTKRRGLVRYNPLTDRPKYQTAKMVKHCRDFMPGDSGELHACAGKLMEHRHSAVLGFQQLFEAMTGLRTCEILKWRTDAGPNDAGYVTPDGKSLRVWRCKCQASVNPFVKVHDGLVALLDAHREWKQTFYPNSPWYFPGHSKDGAHPVDKGALAHALRRLHEILKLKKLTSHGCRAFYVTVRRSHGMTDAQIAFEIGHTSGGATLAAVYGGVPPHWLTGEGPKMSWLPINGQPAWKSIKPPGAPRRPVHSSGAPSECPPQALAA